ncbi:phage tail terminator family protein [Cohnella boryungensis]|uniref:phage tail terminator family protein n=1 Tax=Cohnella boryungensis TaxID=768479 RepID=UPI00366FB8AF
MSQVSFNSVRYAVHAALDDTFPEIPISGEEIPQGLEAPYFYVRLLEPGHTRELGRRYKRRYPFVIRYFAIDRQNDAMYSMAEQLTEALERITVGGCPCDGHDIRFQIENEVLYFWVTYSLFVWKPRPDDPKMETLEQHGGIKDES